MAILNHYSFIADGCRCATFAADYENAERRMKELFKPKKWEFVGENVNGSPVDTENYEVKQHKPKSHNWTDGSKIDGTGKRVEQRRPFITKKSAPTPTPRKESNAEIAKRLGVTETEVSIAETFVGKHN